MIPTKETEKCGEKRGKKSILRTESEAHLKMIKHLNSLMKEENLNTSDGKRRPVFVSAHRYSKEKRRGSR